MKRKVGFIGAGNMGSAIIAAIYKAYKVEVCETDEKKSVSLKDNYKISTKALKNVVKNVEVLIVAVKPQVFKVF